MNFIRATIMSIVTRYLLQPSFEERPCCPFFLAARAAHALLRQFTTASNLASSLWLLRRRCFNNFSTHLTDARRLGVCAYCIGQSFVPIVSAFALQLQRTMEEKGQTLEKERAGHGLACHAI